MTTQTLSHKRPSYETLTNEIITSMETCDKWQSGISGIASDIPINSKGNYYSGINILLLWVSSMQHGFTGSQWMTYKQAKDKKAQIRKGEHGTKIIFYKTWDRVNESGDVEKIPVMKTYTVFNTAQIDYLPDQENNNQVNQWRSIDAGESLSMSSECPVIVENVTPCYSPALDQIKMPGKTTFNTPENYYATLAHEMAHSTGHKTRLNRLNEKNKSGYAFEELVAELSAVFTCSKLGIKGDIENHASYIKSWLKAMKNDNKYIFKAATLASKASDYLLANMQSNDQDIAA